MAIDLFDSSREKDTHLQLEGSINDSFSIHSATFQVDISITLPYCTSRIT